MAAIEISVAEQTVGTNETGRTIEFIRRNPTVVISASILITMFLLAIFAPFFEIVLPALGGKHNFDGCM